jgi:signal recognition particle subunit SEC65
MIETILFCLSDATKGTIYRIGPMPELRTIRVTSGVRNETTGEIFWGFNEYSDYNYPGKCWEDFKDRPGRPLEAMAWCVENAKSWTADDPQEDRRSVRKQLSNEPEDYHHMEPVLIKKSYLYGDLADNFEYPVDWQGNSIWEDCDNLVVAVIKIHFKKGHIKRGDHSTKVIKKLSRTLGTQLLSLHIRETLSEAQKDLARQRLQSCNVLAHELRNTLIKLGFIFSAINAEISFLREQWESQIAIACPDIENKSAILEKLNRLIESNLPVAKGTTVLRQLCETLMAEQRELSDLSLMPGLGEKWVENKIRPKWQKLMVESDLWEPSREEILSLLGRLKEAMWLGTNKDLASRMDHLPDDLRSIWPELAYVDFTVDKLMTLEKILDFLDHPDLKIPHKQQTKKILTSLKALVEMIPEVEERTNRIIHSLRNGSFENS